MDKMKAVGIVMVVLSALVIGYNVLFAPAWNEHKAREEPLTTLLTGGKNLQQAYTFTPPLTGFEIAIYLVLITGVLITWFRWDE